MTDKKVKQIVHFIRWSLELGILWFLVLPETGFWTTFTLMMLTAGSEVFWFVPSDWKRDDAGKN